MADQRLRVSDRVQRLMDLCVAAPRQSERREAVEELVRLLTAPPPAPKCICTEEDKPWCICYSGR